MSTTDYSSVRVSGATSERIDDHKREGESKGDVIDRALDALEGDVVPRQDVAKAVEQLGGAVGDE